MHDLQHRNWPHGPYSSTPAAQIHRASDNPTLDFSFRVWNDADENHMHGCHANCEGGFSPEGTVKQESSPLLHHNHHYSHFLPSADARLQGIARGRRELMEMVPEKLEFDFELSSEDIADERKQNARPTFEEEEDAISKEKELSADTKAQLHINKQKRKKILRSESLDSRQFLLKMFFPTFSARAPKSLAPHYRSIASPKPSFDVGTEKLRESMRDSMACNHSIVSPRLLFDGTEKLMEEERKRRCAVGSDSERSGRSSRHGSTSSSSSRSNGSRHADDCISPSCWPLFDGRRSKFK